MKGRCLVLGGGGFIGAAVCRELQADGWAVRVFERGTAPAGYLDTSPNVEWFTGEFQDAKAIRQALQGIAAVVHLISTTLPKTSNESPLFDVTSNVGGTLQLLDAMCEAGVRRIVFASSGGTVYGIPQRLPITEDHPTQPEVSYGISKLAIEKYLYLYQRLRGLQPVVLRVSNPYGEGQRVETAQGAIAAFTHRALTKQPIQIWGDGTVTRDYLHVRDVGRAFAHALRFSGVGVFNISSGTGISLNGIVEELENILGRKVEVEYQAGRSFDVPVNILSNDHARAELDWHPQFPLEEGLRMTVQYFKSALNKHASD